MVGAHDVGKDESVFQRWAQSWSDPEVVDAPANIAVACAREVVPVGVVVGLVRMELTKCIKPSIGAHRVEHRTFFRKKSGVGFVFFGTRQINGMVCDVVVATDYDVLAPCLLLFAACKERVVELELIWHTRVAGGAVWEVDVVEYEGAIVELENAPLFVEFLDAEMLVHRKRLRAAEHSNARIAALARA